jgi:hypothetical protein
MTDLPPDTDLTPSKPDTAPADGARDDLTRRLGLSGSQVAARALAAVSSAVAASYLGVGGTVIGAGVGSVIATVSTALYQHSLTRTNERIRRAVPMPARRPPWTKLAAGAALVFGVALGSIAVFEQVTGGPISSTVRGDDRRGSTLGELVSPDRRESRPDPVRPVPEPSSTGTPTPAPATTPPATPNPPPSAPPATPPATTPPTAPPSSSPPTAPLTQPPVSPGTSS